MMGHRVLKGVAVSVMLLVGVTACGGGGGAAPSASSSAPSGGTTAAKAPDASYIEYLSQNYASYSDAATGKSPQASFDDSNFSVRWVINTQTTEQAENLKKHVEYMEQSILAGQNPRAWDKLFLLDAYFDQSHAYTTQITVSGTQITIDKVAKNACAYGLIKTHAVGVGGWFFHGEIQVSFSNYADRLMADASCDAERPAMTAYIDAHIQPLPKGISLLPLQ